MTKTPLNQNGKYVQELMDTINADFIFTNKPINRFKVIENKNDSLNINKIALLSKLREKINSIENCNLKGSSKNIVMGDGDIDSPLMIIGETPGQIENNSNLSFQGDIGSLLKKMLSAIDIKIEKVYKTYSINFRPPEDRKHTTLEIKRSL